jgi:FkbM family methyltransferase
MNFLKFILKEFLPNIIHSSFALNQLDLKLAPFLNYKNGFFIEAGANDGVTYSNTLYFEKYKKWTGILIEPIPELAEKCKLNRPGCIVEQAALVPSSFKESQIEMWYCNHMSVVKGAMKSETEQMSHIEKGAEIQNVRTYELKVPAKNLSAIIDKYSIRNIDFLSLDVEGFELSVLRGIDFDRHRPTFMLIEARYRSEIEAYLNSIYEPIAEFSKFDVLYKALNI